MAKINPIVARTVLWLIGIGTVAAGGGKLYMDGEKAREDAESRATTLEKRLNTSEELFQAKLLLEQQKRDFAIVQSGQRVGELEEKLITAQSLIDDITNKHGDTRSELEEVFRGLEAANLDIEALKTRNDALEMENRKMADKLSRTEGLSEKLVVENKELTKRLTESEKSVVDIAKSVKSKVGSDELHKLVEKTLPSVVMFSSGKGAWTGFVLKIEGKRYFATCSHFTLDKKTGQNKGIYDYVGAIDLPGVAERVYDISFLNGKGNVKMPAIPLQNGLVGYLPIVQGDFAIFPVPDELSKKVFDKVEKETGIPIGLELEDMKNPPKLADTVFNIGNPLQNDFTFHPRVISAGDRVIKMEKDGPLLCDYQFFPGPSGGESGSPLINKSGKVVGIVTRQEGPHVGFATNYQQIKYDLHTAFKLPGVVSEAEKKTTDWQWYEKNIKTKKAFTVEELKIISRLSLSLTPPPVFGGLPLSPLLPTTLKRAWPHGSGDTSTIANIERRRGLFSRCEK